MGAWPADMVRYSKHLVKQTIMSKVGQIDKIKVKSSYKRRSFYTLRSVIAMFPLMCGASPKLLSIQGTSGQPHGAAERNWSACHI